MANSRDVPLYFAWCPKIGQTQNTAEPWGALDAKRAAQLHMRKVCKDQDVSAQLEWPVLVVVIDPDGSRHEFGVHKEIIVDYVAHEVT